MQMKRFIYSFLLLFACFGPKELLAEVNNKTLTRIQQIKQPKNQVRAYGKAAEKCWRTGKYEEGLIYARKGLAAAQKAGYTTGEPD